MSLILPAFGRKTNYLRIKILIDLVHQNSPSGVHECVSVWNEATSSSLRPKVSVASNTNVNL